MPGEALAQGLPVAGMEGFERLRGGRRLDPETIAASSQPSGLYYYRARTYSPTWGRFLQPDPIGYPAGTNLYAYVHNDPLNLTDPFGLTPDSPPSAGGSLMSLLQDLNPIGTVVAAGTSNKLGPDPNATGPHSTYRVAPNGTIQNYETYEQNPATGTYDPLLRYRGTGKPHGGVEPPLILERPAGKGPGSTPNVPRPALPSEIPGNVAPPVAEPVVPELPEIIIPDIIVP